MYPDHIHFTIFPDPPRSYDFPKEKKKRKTKSNLCCPYTNWSMASPLKKTESFPTPTLSEAMNSSASLLQFLRVLFNGILSRYSPSLSPSPDLSVSLCGSRPDNHMVFSGNTGHRHQDGLLQEYRPWASTYRPQHGLQQQHRSQASTGIGNNTNHGHQWKHRPWTFTRPA